MQNIIQNMEKILVLLREKVPLAVKRSAVKHAAVWKSSCSAESTSSCSILQCSAVDELANAGEAWALATQ